MASSEYGHQASFSLREKVIAEQSDEGLTVTMRISSAISGNTYPLLAIRYHLFATHHSPNPYPNFAITLMPASSANSCSIVSPNSLHQPRTSSTV